MYKLNKNSNTSNFYEWVWGTEVTKFKTMCPYFWGYVATLIFLPLILLGKFLYYVLPAKKKIGKALDYVIESKVGKVIDNGLEKISKLDRLWILVGSILKWIWIFILGFFSLLSIVMLGFSVYNNPTESLEIIGLFF